MPKASVWEVCRTGFENLPSMSPSTSLWGLSHHSKIELPNETVMDVAEEVWDIEPEKAKAVMAEELREELGVCIDRLWCWLEGWLSSLLSLLRSMIWWGPGGSR
jgi:hypothetical protein